MDDRRGAAVGVIARGERAGGRLANADRYRREVRPNEYASVSGDVKRGRAGRVAGLRRSGRGTRERRLAQAWPRSDASCRTFGPPFQIESGQRPHLPTLTAPGAEHSNRTPTQSMGGSQVGPLQAIAPGPCRPSSSAGSHGSVSTASVIDNVFIARIPRAAVGPTAMTWRSASGATIKTIPEPSRGGGAPGFGQAPD